MSDRPTFDDLLRVMARLRAPNGCAWDRAQTHESLRPYLLEEAYEALDAIGDPARLCDELGDVLLQVVFHAQMAAEAGTFTVDDVVRGLHDKLIRRHPHVFGTMDDPRHAAATPEAVKEMWDERKRAERVGAEDATTSSLGHVPSALPALMTSQKLQQRAAAAGFAWPDPASAAAKVDEEWSELQSAIAGGDARGAHEEVGDILMAVVNVAAAAGVDAEMALRDACGRFKARFAAMARFAADAGASLERLSAVERAQLWRDAKRSSG